MASWIALPERPCDPGHSTNNPDTPETTPPVQLLHLDSHHSRPFGSKPRECPLITSMRAICSNAVGLVDRLVELPCPLRATMQGPKPSSCSLSTNSVSMPSMPVKDFQRKMPTSTSSGIQIRRRRVGINGQPQAPGQAIDMHAAQLDQTSFIAGSAAGVDQIWARAFDGWLWSDWHPLSVTGHA